MASEQAIQFREMMSQAAASVDTAPTVEALRTMFQSFGLLAAPIPPDTKVEHVDADGVPSLLITPRDAGTTVLVYLHGGGYVMGSAATHERTAAHLAARLQARAFVVDYGLAPENPHPGPVEDCLTAYWWLLRSGVDHRDVVFAGDSAGGALVLTTQLLARERGLGLPTATATLSPWVDLRAFGSPGEEDAAPAGAQVFVQLLLGPDGDLDDPLVNPVNGDLTGFGPIYIQVGGEEPELIGGARQLADKAKAAGIEVELDIVPEMLHMFQLWAGVMPEADAALDRIATFLRAGLTHAGQAC